VKKIGSGDQLEIKNCKKVTNYRHVNLWEIEYVDRFGGSRQWQVATRMKAPKCVSMVFDRADAVVIVPFHQTEKRLVIIREFRVPLGGYQYGFPAGLVDSGETVYDAAARELKEETGLTVVDFLTASPPVYSSSGMTDESVSMVYVTCNGTPSNRGNARSEDIETLMVTPGEASLLCSDTKIKFDVKTWLVLSSYAERGFFPG
jgi:ADP-ribose pyrophosphatase